METEELISDYISKIKRKIVTSHVLETIRSLKIGPKERTILEISKWLLKHAFWAVIYLICTLLTIKECLNIYHSYISSSTSTIISMSDGEGVEMPNITICIPVNLTVMFPRSQNESNTPYSDAISHFLASHIVDGRFQFQPYNYNLTTTLWIDLGGSQHIHWLVNMPPDFLSITRNSFVSLETLYVLQKYLAILYEAENLRESEENPFINLRNNTDDESTALWKILVPKITEQKISIDQIKAVFDEFFRLSMFYFSNGHSFMFLFGQVYRNKQGIINYESVTADAITYWDSNRICLNINGLNSLQLDDEVKQNPIDFQIIISPWFFLTHVIDDKAIITVDLHGSSLPPESINYKTTYSVAMFREVRQEISVQVSFFTVQLLYYFLCLEGTILTAV
jgi:hypothetical protein